MGSEVMIIKVKNKKESAAACDALMVPVFEDEGIAPYKSLDAALEGRIKKMVKSGEFTGKRDEILLIHTLGKITPERLLLVGLGKKDEFDAERLRCAGGKALSRIRGKVIKKVALSSRVLTGTGLSPVSMIEGMMLADYRFSKYREKDENNGPQEVTILSAEDLEDQIRWTELAVRSVHFARNLVTTPSNDLTPADLASIASEIKNLSVRIIEKKQAKKLGLGAFLAISKGSAEPPKFIEMTYRKSDARPLVLIGKSITFDSGGISIKPSLGMEKMKYDMAGGAAVLGVMKAITALGLPVHVVALLPATENLPGGSAYKPGDVLKTVSGKTVEVISTDAEGRLALADAIGYAQRFKPEAIIDIATLTGACSIALGNEAMAMFSNDESLAERMKAASDATGERVWPMPLYDEYGDYIKSDIADLKNASGRSGSLPTAAYFLKRFAGDTPWLHLDIAGTAWTDKARPYIPKGATGIGVRLLLEFLRNYRSSTSITG
jgi:leucyl aminopeptidase